MTLKSLKVLWHGILRETGKREAAFWIRWTILSTQISFCWGERQRLFSFITLPLFWTASHEHFFPLSLSFFYSFPSLLPCSLPSLSFSRNGYNTGYLQLFIPMALILVLVATQKADFTSDLQTPVGPRSLSRHLLYPWSAGKGSESLRKIHLTEKGIKLLWCEEQCTGVSPP